MRLPRVSDRSNLIALVGGLLGLLAYVGTPLVAVRPNRLGSGVGVYALSVGGHPGWPLLAVWPAITMLAAFGPRTPRRGLLLAGAGSLALVLSAFSVESAARSLLVHAPALAKVSLSWGAWLAMAAAYVVVFGAATDPRAPHRWARGLFEAARWSGLAAVAVMAAAGFFSDMSLARELADNGGDFAQRLLEHLQLSGAGVVGGVLIGVPAGVFVARRRWAGGAVMTVVELLQTVPSLALLGLLIAPLGALAIAVPALAAVGVAGIGPAPAYVALTVYGLLPMVRNTYTALVEVDPAMIDAGRGMGMTGRELLWRVELPLASPLILEGVRTSAVQLIGIAALMALIDAGGLGTYIFRGVGQGADDFVLLGALPIVALAVIVDRLMRAAVAAATPKGMRAAGDGADGRPPVAATAGSVAGEAAA
jgi:osmoprotectant transport system permease protein